MTRSSVENSGLDVTYEYLGSQTVPAGTFEDCWQLTRWWFIPLNPDEEDVRERRDYCRGVGIIRVWGYDSMDEDALPTIYLELTDYDVQ